MWKFVDMQAVRRFLRSNSVVTTEMIQKEFGVGPKQAAWIAIL